MVRIGARLARKCRARRRRGGQAMLIRAARLLDGRLVDVRLSAGRIEGSSYRMREHAALVPENVRAGAAFNPPLPRRRGRPPTKGKPDPEYG